MKKILLAFLTLLPITVVAQEETLPNTLVVYLNSGVVQEYPLQDWPEITFDGTDMVINSGNATAIITRDEINRYEFGFNEEGGVESVTCDKNVVRRGNEIYIANMRPGTPVAVYTIEGRLAMQANANAAGEVCVSLDNLVHGIYLLKVNNLTTKIIKQ